MGQRLGPNHAQDPIHGPHVSQAQSPPKGPRTRGCMIRVLEYILILGQLLGHALLNLLISLQIMLIQTQLCLGREFLSKDSFPMVPSVTMHETCEGGHLARDTSSFASNGSMRNLESKLYICISFPFSFSLH